MRGGKFLSKAAWYYHRLRSMSPHEVAHRADEQVKRAAWRWYVGGWDRFDAGDGMLFAMPALRSSLSNATPSLQEHIVASAQGILDRPLEIFGRQWGDAPLAQLLATDPLVFHLDPVSRQHWPTQIYCFDISYRDLQTYGDYKFCAELNTLQVCQALAAAAHIEKDQRIEQLVWAIWKAWYEANPPFLGINWVSGVNIALRVVSLLMTASLLAAPSDTVRRSMRALLNASGFWLERYPSLHSSANNHLLAESVALFALGMLCPDLPGANRYGRIGRQRVEQQASRLILADGAGAEMSPSYAAFAIEWILLAAIVGETAGQPFGPEVMDRITEAARFFKWLMDDAGEVPSIGDNDNSCVIGTGSREKGYVASITAAIAGGVGRPELAPPACEPALRDVLFRSPRPGASQGDGIRHFDRGGLSVVRETRQSVRAVLTFDHGPLGYLEIAAHGHADTLSLWLSLGKQPVLVDAGTYLYGANNVWREHFRATRVHNTVELGGQSSSAMSGPFNWSQKASGHLIRARDGADWRIEAEHDGYRSAFGCKHIRCLTRTSSGFRVEDRLKGGTVPVRIGFLIHPDLSAAIERHTVHVTGVGEPIVSLASLSGWTPRIIQGEDHPPGGWHSAYFGTKVPAAQVVFAGTMGAEPVVTEVVIHAWDVTP
jgi:hypothetical protein